MLFIFDLDGTTIDSSHRQNTLADGTLNLAHWIDNNTPEKIARDSLLPLADSWRTIDQTRHDVVIMTARVIGDADLAFLVRSNLRYRFIYSRPIGSTIADGILKQSMIRQCARDLGVSLAWMRYNAFMFDDSENVRNALQSMGIRVYNPISYNARNA